MDDDDFDNYDDDDDDCNGFDDYDDDACDDNDGGGCLPLVHGYSITGYLGLRAGIAACPIPTVVLYYYSTAGYTTVLFGCPIPTVCGTIAVLVSLL